MTRGQIIKRWLLSVAALLVLAAGTIYLYLRPPSFQNFYPPCILHLATGLHCPGCGTTRCMHAVVHGEFAQAAAYNIISLVLLPFVVAWVICCWIQYLRGRPFPRWFLAPNTYRWFVLCFLLFGVLRNLPFYPFNLLAPHQL